VTLCLPAQAGHLVQVCPAHRTQAAATFTAHRPHRQRQIDLLPNDIAKIYRISVDKINFHIVVEQFDFFLIRSLSWKNQVDMEIRFQFPVERLKTTIAPYPDSSADRSVNKELVDRPGNLRMDAEWSVRTKDLIVLITRLPPPLFQHFIKFCFLGDSLKVDDH
jgi:hypothetical protein